MKTKICKPEYLAKVKLLTEEETERLLSRMVGKLPRRLEKDKLNTEEALAIQLELEDEQLQEWRNKMHSLKEKELAKVMKKGKTPEKVKAPEKAEVVEKNKPAAKAKVPVKAKLAEKPNAPEQAVTKEKSKKPFAKT